MFKVCTLTNRTRSMLDCAAASVYVQYGAAGVVGYYFLIIGVSIQV